MDPKNNLKADHIQHWENRINELAIVTPEIDTTLKLNLHNKFIIHTETFGPEYKKHLMHSQLNIYTDG